MERLCEGCVFWLGPWAFASSTPARERDWCEVCETPPQEACARALYPLRRELRGFPAIRGALENMA